ncbi:MAG: multiple sugar transport system ATP-binding protein [Myxococcota bacterium]|jgi:multiple sugar transport system ATP-binding protein
MASVELAGVHKRYDDTHVVKGVDIQIADGEFLVLVGPSGCGKSTCLRMIAGLEEITEGTISIGGRVVNNLPPKDRNIGMVFQSYALYPHMTVRENMAFGLKLKKTPPAVIKERVDEAAALLDIEALLDRRPKALSGGQRQRVAMGRAIVRRPQVFLFDEPLSNLDAALRVQMRAELSALHRRLGTTMVYVTHDQVEAMTLATRIAVLHEGVLQQVGPALELYARPANKFVAGFIGSPAMNFVDGVCTGNGGGATFVADTLSLDLAGEQLAAVTSIGVRPNEVSLVATDHAGAVVGEVTVVEPMGWEAFVHVQTPVGVMVAQVRGNVQQINAGDQVGVVMAADRCHLFDESGITLWSPAPE